MKRSSSVLDSVKKAGVRGAYTHDEDLGPHNPRSCVAESSDVTLLVFRSSQP